MTIATVTALHDLPELVVGDLIFQVAPPRQRKTIEIVIERDASLVLKAPPAATIERATRFVNAKRQWIYRKLVEKDALAGRAGRQAVCRGRRVRLPRPKLPPHPHPAGDRRTPRPRPLPPLGGGGRSVAPRPCSRWYTEVGTKWLRKRVRPWAARLGEELRDRRGARPRLPLGLSAPHRGCPTRINIHWATLQLPPSLIDYVLVHELAHLRVPNHTPGFWYIVERLMPAYQTPKTTLAGLGKNIWLAINYASPM